MVLQPGRKTAEGYLSPGRWEYQRASTRLGVRVCWSVSTLQLVICRKGFFKPGLTLKLKPFCFGRRSNRLPHCQRRHLSRDNGNTMPADLISYQPKCLTDIVVCYCPEGHIGRCEGQPIMSFVQ